MKSKKGLYEIFTVMFFIFAMLIALFLWLSVSGTVTLIKAEEGEQRLSITSARETYTAIIQCSGNSVIQEKEINECVKQDFDFVKAVAIEQPAIDNCEKKEWNSQNLTSALEDTSVNTYPYWVSIQNDASVCLARMVIAI